MEPRLSMHSTTELPSQPHLFKDDPRHPKSLGTIWMIMTIMISQVEMRNMLLKIGGKAILGTK